MAPKPALPTPPKPPAFPSGIKPSTLPGATKATQQYTTPAGPKAPAAALKIMVTVHIPFTIAMELLKLVELKLPLVVV